MDEIKVVINISKHEWEYLNKLVKNGDQLGHYERLLVNGTPLPKGHGKLIVEPTEEDIAKTIGGQNDFAECIRDSVKAVFDNADAIIEAEKGESEG